jgi:hypothetical protein
MVNMMTMTSPMIKIVRQPAPEHPPIIPPGPAIRGPLTVVCRRLDPKIGIIGIPGVVRRPEPVENPPKGLPVFRLPEKPPVERPVPPLPPDRPPNPRLPPPPKLLPPPPPPRFAMV